MESARDHDTRDIVIDTRAQVRGLAEDFREFARESKANRAMRDQEDREHRTQLQAKLDRYDKIINRGAGATFILGALGGVVSTWLSLQWNKLFH